MKLKRIHRDKLEIAAAKKIKERDFWLNKLHGAPVKSGFLFDYDKRKPGESSIKELVYHFPQGIFSKLAKLSRGSDHTLNVILAAGLAALLNKYTGSRDIIFGAPVYKQKIETDFINTLLVLRNTVKENMTFKDLLLQVSQTIMEATENYSYPLEILPGDFPFIDIAILVENIHDREYLRHINPSITFCFLRKEHSLEVILQYNSLLYKKDTIARIAVHYAQLLEVFLSNLESKISVMDFLPEEEKNRVLFEFNNTGSEYPGHKTIPGLFAEQAARTGDHIAVISPEPGTGALTYRELNKRTEQLACMLERKGVMPGIIVAIMVERSLEMIVGILGILKTGAAYLPIDPDYPEERIKYMLKDSNARILLKKSEIRKPKFETNPNDPNSNDQNKRAAVTVLDLEYLNFEFVSNFEFRASNFVSANLAYIIYTSGSTGNPKAVMIRQKSLINLLFALNDAYPFLARDSYPLKTSFLFDVSISELFGWFLGGGRLVGLEKDAEADPLRIIEVIKNYQITHINFVPSMFNLFVDSLNPETCRKLRSLRYIFLAGEALLPEVVRKFKRLNTGIRLENLYGPTEAAVYASKYSVRDWDDSPVIPIGRPMKNVKLYILDQDVGLRPIGVPGELVISGDGLAIGYLNRVELTAEKFDHDLWDLQDYQLIKNYKLQNTNYKQITNHKLQITNKPVHELPPTGATSNKKFLRGGPGGAVFSKRVPPGRRRQKIYKTGDLARWLPDGNIEFLGRIDHQVKIRGFRIELGEIENRLLTHDGVKETVVLSRKDKNGDNYLCAYIVSGNEHQVPGFREFLLRYLPDYMVPSYFVQVENIPLNPNGKIDRKALPAPVFTTTGPYIAPGNEIEKKLVEIWSEILTREKEQIGIDTNFLQLGGHSLKAHYVAAKIHKIFDVTLPLAKVFEIPTIRGLARYIQASGTGKYQPVKAVEKKEYHRLTPAQERLYILQRMELESTMYNMPRVLPLREEVDPGQLEKAINKLISRHESLRTSFHLVNDQPVQRIHDKVEFEIEYYDLQLTGVLTNGDRCGEEGSEKSASPTRGPRPAAAFINSFIYPFDLSRAPLLRVGLIHTAGSRRLLLFDMHHIITDGTSQAILEEELLTLYSGKEPPLLRLQYKDYARWQNSGRQQELIKRQETYWLRLFPGEVPVLNLPVDYPRPLLQSFAGRRIHFALTGEETKQLKTTAEENGSTLYMMILAVFNILLAKLSGEEDIIVGTPVAGRLHPDAQPIMGMFVNTLAMRNYPRGDKTFKEFLREVKKHTLDAYENQAYPFDRLVEKISVSRDTGRNPVFDVMFNLLNQTEYTGNFFLVDETGLEYYENVTAKFDLNLAAIDREETLQFGLEYCTRLFKEETVQRMIKYFKRITGAVMDNPEQRLSELEILPDEEMAGISRVSSGETAEPVGCGTIRQWFEEIVEKVPGNTALVWGETRVTYDRLNKKANRLARKLRREGVTVNTVVGLMVERSIEMVVAIIAILKAGGAYLPIDPDYPEERKKYMMKNSRVNILVTNCPRQRTPTDLAVDTRVIDIGGEKNRGESGNLKNINKPGDPLYIIYTSGSTGQPKGVVLEHRNLINLIRYQYRCTDIDFSRVLQFITISFDVSFQEIFSTLLAGGELYLISKETRDNIPGLFHLIEKNEIKTLFLPTGFLKFVFTVDDYIDIFPGGIRHLVTAGEQLVINDRFKEYLRKNHVYLHNHYGPAETHVVTSLTIDPSGEIPQLPSIGRPVLNTAIYILDRYRHLLPMGVSGELYIGGMQVGRGYLDHPELTSEKFDQDFWDYQDKKINQKFLQGGPGGTVFSKRVPPGRRRQKIYKTGDLARWLPGGNIDFLGRIDHQVKIRGFRIELGEIESQLLKREEIKEAVVLAREKQDGDRYLCAYIVTDDKDAPNQGSHTSELRDYLSHLLPDYMVPSFYVKMARMPLTPNGKINRSLLPEPGFKDGTTKYTAPRHHLERQLAAIWSQVLGIEREKTGIDDNFFQSGGHSLKATILVAKVHKELNVRLPLAELFKTPTIRGLARRIRQSIIHRHLSIAPQEKKEYYILSSAQKRLYILQQADLKSVSYNMSGVFTFTGDLSRDRFEYTCQALIRRHEALRTSFCQVKGEVFQEIEDHISPKLVYKEISHEKQVTKQIREFVKSFDLSRAPLFRVELIKLTEKKHFVLFDVHHIISDGSSLRLLIEDFARLYRGTPPGALSVHYKDYAAWQDKRINKEKEEYEGYWLEKLRGFAFTRIPIDRYDSYNRIEGKARHLEVRPPLYDEIEIFCNKHDITKFTFMITVFNIVLAREIDQADITVGTPVSIKNHHDLKDVMGIFLNVLLIRTIIDDEDSFVNHLAKTKETVVSALNNRDYPYEMLNAKMNEIHDLKRDELFSVLFNYFPVQENKEIISKDIEIRSLELPEVTPKYDMTLYVQDAYKNKSMVLNSVYKSNIYDLDTIKSVLRGVLDVIHRVLENEHIKLSQLTLPGEVYEESYDDFDMKLENMYKNEYDYN